MGWKYSSSRIVCFFDVSCLQKWYVLVGWFFATHVARCSRCAKSHIICAFSHIVLMPRSNQSVVETRGRASPSPQCRSRSKGKNLSMTNSTFTGGKLSQCRSRSKERISFAIYYIDCIRVSMPLSQQGKNLRLLTHVEVML